MEISRTQTNEHSTPAVCRHWLIALVLLLASAYSNAGLVVETGGLGNGLRVSVDNLGDQIVTGFKLMLTWDLGPDEIDVDFWSLDYGVSLGGGGLIGGSAESRLQSCTDPTGFSCVAKPPIGDAFFDLEVMSLNTDAEIAAAQLPFIAANGGKLLLLDIVLASLTQIGHVQPDNLQVSAMIFGEGGKMISTVPEPTSVFLLGSGLLAMMFARRRVRGRGRQ